MFLTPKKHSKFSLKSAKGTPDRPDVRQFSPVSVDPIFLPVYPDVYFSKILKDQLCRFVRSLYERIFYFKPPSNIFSTYLYLIVFIFSFFSIPIGPSLAYSIIIRPTSSSSSNQLSRPSPSYSNGVNPTESSIKNPRPSVMFYGWNGGFNDGTIRIRGFVL